MAKNVVGSMMIQVAADTARLQRDMNTMRKEVHGFTSGSMTAFKALGAAILAAFSFRALERGFESTMTQFMEFETALARIGNVSGESLSVIQKRLMEIDPALGNMTELAQGYYQVMSAGITETQQALEMLITSAQVSKESHVAQADAVRGLASVLSTYSKELGNAKGAADLLYTIEAKGITTVGELIPHIGALSNLAKATGLSVGEMGAALSQVSKTGAGTSESVTQLQSLLTNLSKKFDDMPPQIREYGSALEAIKALGFEGVLQTIMTATAGNTSELSKMLGRQESMLALLQLSKNGFADYRKVLDEVKGSVGSFDAAWARYEQTLKAVWERFKNVVGNQVILIGEKLVPTIKILIDQLGRWLEKMRDPIADKFGAWLKNIVGDAQVFADKLTNIITKIDSFLTTLGKLSDMATAPFKAVYSGMEKIIGLGKTIDDWAEATHEYVLKFYGEGSSRRLLADKIIDIKREIESLNRQIEIGATHTTYLRDENGVPLTKVLQDLKKELREVERLGQTAYGNYPKGDGEETKKKKFIDYTSPSMSDLQLGGFDRAESREKIGDTWYYLSQGQIDLEKLYRFGLKQWKTGVNMTEATLKQLDPQKWKEVFGDIEELNKVQDAATKTIVAMGESADKTSEPIKKLTQNMADLVRVTDELSEKEISIGSRYGAGRSGSAGRSGPGPSIINNVTLQPLYIGNDKEAIRKVAQDMNEELKRLNHRWMD